MVELLRPATLKFIIKILREMAKGNTDILDCTDYGICWNLDNKLEEYAGCHQYDAYAIVSTLAEYWPEHTGYKNYPVPHETYGTSPWENPARLRLCAYIADKLESEL